MQKRASQVFLDPIQKRALSRSVHLEAVYLEALLYLSVSHMSRKSKSLLAMMYFQKHGFCVVNLHLGKFGPQPGGE